MTISPDYQRDWPAYFDAVADQPPRDTLLRALALTKTSEAEPIAIDLACGEGRDTRAMVASPLGFRVFAVDNSTDALQRLNARLLPSDALRVTAVPLALEAVPTHAWCLEGGATLINASFALPFCHEDAFPALWQWIITTLTPGGRFAGQLFGDRDEWASVNPRRHFSREQVLTLLQPFEIEYLDEVEKDGSDALMRVKHHHLFHIVGRKR